MLNFCLEILGGHHFFIMTECKISSSVIPTSLFVFPFIGRKTIVRKKAY